MNFVVLPAAGKDNCSSFFKTFSRLTTKIIALMLLCFYGSAGSSAWAIHSSQSTAQSCAMTIPVYLQPFGEFPAEDLPVIAAGLEREFRVKVTILPVQPIPQRIARTARGRLRAESMLDYLGTLCPINSKIVGLTSVDISVTKGATNDWGIFGLGDLQGAAAVVSSCRIKAAPQKRQALITMIARHEVGHNFGLKHCPDKRCLMAAGDDISNEAADFCPRCTAKIHSILKTTR